MAETFSPADYLAEIERAATASGFGTHAFGEVSGQRLIACTKRTAGRRPRVYLSAGIHGDEPAGPLALLELMRRGIFDRRAVWFVCPLLNPHGFERRSRENADGLDLNRDYHSLKSAEIQAHARWLRSQPNFDLTFCLHEDWESTGFYLYELNPTGLPTLARSMIEAASPFCPLDTSTVIDGRPIAEPGIIRPINDPLERDLWPEAIYLRAHHTLLSYTLESPSALPLEQRINAQCAAVEAALDHLATPVSQRATPARIAVESPAR